jgi:hypothetical protein
VRPVVLICVQSPGDYYIRAVLKEYKFEPATITATVKEGIVESVRMTATRHAYSCFGTVRHLGGQRVPGVHVEAVSEACNQLHEEDKTNVNGEFRVRGLNPGCRYRVSVRPEGQAAVGTFPMALDVEVPVGMCAAVV